MAKKYYWLKLPSNFFVDPKIKKLRRIAGGDTYVIIFLKMMLLVINTNGILEFEGIEKTLEDELSLKLDEDENNVKVVLAFLSSNGELEEVSDEAFLLQRVPDLIGKEGDSAERMRKLRERQNVGEIPLTSHCDGYVTRSDTEKEKDIEKEIKPSLFLSPTPERKERFDLKYLNKFREELITTCPTFAFSLQGKMGYSSNHLGFCIKGGYIFDLHTNKIVKSTESFEIWQYLYHVKTHVLDLAQIQAQNQHKEENYANHNQ